MGTPVTISIPHQLGRAEARRRIESGFGNLREQIPGAQSLQHAWSDDRMEFTLQGLGQRITGRLDVLDDAVKMEIDLPAFFAAIADKVKAKIRKQGQLLLEKK